MSNILVATHNIIYVPNFNENNGTYYDKCPYVQLSHEHKWYIKIKLMLIVLMMLKKNLKNKVTVIFGVDNKKWNSKKIIFFSIKLWKKVSTHLQLS